MSEEDPVAAAYERGFVMGAKLMRAAAANRICRSRVTSDAAGYFSGIVEETQIPAVVEIPEDD